PIAFYLSSLSDKLQQELKNEYKVYATMRYGKPSLKRTLEQIRNDNPDEIIILPLFPQYASSTTGTVAEKVFDVVKNWQAIPSIRLLSQFYNHPALIKAFAGQLLKYNHTG